MFLELLAIFVITFLVRVVSIGVGGGGMVLLPTLIFFGLSPSQAIATNRLAGFGIFSSVWKFHKHKQVKWKLGFFLVVPTIIGAALGSAVIIFIDQELFKKILGAVILLSLPLLFYKKDIGIKSFDPSKKRLITSLFLSLIAGFVGGTVASTGIWFNYVFLYLGLTFLEAAGTKKIIGFTVVTTSVAILIFTDLMVWHISAVMFVANLIGSWVGAGVSLKMGNVWIKRLFVLVTAISAIKILLF